MLRSLVSESCIGNYRKRGWSFDGYPRFLSCRLVNPFARWSRIFGLDLTRRVL
jgi:hypothetical protein